MLSYYCVEYLQLTIDKHCWYEEEKPHIELYESCMSGVLAGKQDAKRVSSFIWLAHSYTSTNLHFGSSLKIWCYHCRFFLFKAKKVDLEF